MIFFHNHSGNYNNSRQPVSDRDAVILHQPNGEPPLSPVWRDEIWWLKAGLYSRQTDGLWKHSDLRFTGRWQDTIYVGSWNEAQALVLKAVNITWEIDKAVRYIGLEPASAYVRIEKNQLLALEQIAERWHLMYCGSERFFKRHFRKSIPFYMFNWNYGGE